ncbi:MFS transporter [Rhizobium sp. CSW-27]|nr:MFS transporter [Rhizobium sp. CSW-27]
MSATRLRLLTTLVTGSLFMEVLDGNIITTALPEMAKSLGTSPVELNVGVSAYLLSLGIFIPVSGWIADRLGARSIYTLAIALFTLTSALCATADSLTAFILMRILQGASGAMMVPIGRLVILRQTPKDRLMTAMSNLVWPALIAPVIAPPLGGFITTHFSWHWIFLINLPLGMIAFVAAIILVPNLKEDQSRAFDWRGFFYCSLGTFALLSGLERLATEIDPTGAGFVLAGLVLVTVALRHFRRTASPMLDLSSFRIATFRAAMIGGSVTRMGIGSVPFLLPLLFQMGLGYSAFQSGILLLIVFAGNLAMKIVTTPILRRFGYRRVLLINGALAAFSVAAVAGITTDTSFESIAFILLANGITRSMQFTALGTVAFADIEKSQMSDANSLFNTISQVTMAAGITLGALALRLGEGLTARMQVSDALAAYHVAFLLMALLTLVGLVDCWRLPANAADHFVSRTGNGRDHSQHPQGSDTPRS